MAHTRINSEEFTKYFMQVYSGGGTSLEVATLANLTPRQLYCHVAYLRRKGVKLPRLRRATAVDAKKLNEIVEELL